MHGVVETSIFSRRADALLGRADRAALINALAGDPAAGDLIPSPKAIPRSDVAEGRQGLGGIRKLRFAPVGRGKSGAFRVIYYLATPDVPILALLISC